MAVIGVTERGQAQEAAHVDVRVYPGLDGRAVARLRSLGSDCDARSDAELRCRINVRGVAEFDLVHLNAGEGIARVEATSGTEHPPASSDIVVHDGDGFTERGLAIRVGSTARERAGTCTVVRQRSTATVACGRRPQPTPLTVELIGQVASGPVPSSTPVRTSFAQLEVTSLGAAASRALSSTPDCNDPQERLLVPLSLGQPRSEPVFLCTSTAAASYSIRATVTGVIGISTTTSYTTQAVPQTIYVQEIEAPSADDAGVPPRLLFEVRDCENRPLSGLQLSWFPEGSESPQILALDAVGSANSSVGASAGRGRVAVLDENASVLCETALAPEAP